MEEAEVKEKKTNKAIYIYIYNFSSCFSYYNYFDGVIYCL